MILIVGANGIVRYASPSVERVLGYKPEDLVGNSSWELMHPDELSALQELYTQDLDRLGPAPAKELRMRHRDGSWRCIESVANNLLDDPNVGGILFNSRDVTKRKQAQEQLRKSEERYKSLVMATSQLVWTTNAAGEVNMDLPEWRAYTGQSEEDIRGWGWIEALHPEDRELTAQIWSQAVRARSFYETEYRIRKHDGTYRYFWVRGVPVLEEGDAIREWVGTCTDITERKRAEEELRRRESELTEAQRIAHVGNWSFDITRAERHWSDEMYRIFGFAPQEFPVTYKKFLNLVHPDDRALVRKAVRAAFYEDRDWYSLDYRLIRPEGAVRFLHSQYKIVRDESERSVRIVGTSHSGVRKS